MFLIVVLNVPGDTYDLGLMAALILVKLSDFLCGLNPVHDWHADVRENGYVLEAVVRGSYHLVKSLFSLDAEVHLVIWIEAQVEKDGLH